VLTKKDLVEFEKEIAGIFAEGRIRAPVHLRAGREQKLINIFRKETSVRKIMFLDFGIRMNWPS
jgi:hypothetical protein